MSGKISISLHVKFAQKKLKFSPNFSTKIENKT